MPHLRHLTYEGVAAILPDVFHLDCPNVNVCVARTSDGHPLQPGA